MNLKERKEDAVSPVIGVMLMLVVTIVIAAVVAAFAGGIATDTEPTPSVVLSADAYTNKVVIQSLSGDRLEISKLTVKVYEEDGDFKAVGKFDDNAGTYFTPGMILSLTLNDGTESATAVTLDSTDTVKIVISSNDKHTVFNKEVLVKA